MKGKNLYYITIYFSYSIFFVGSFFSTFLVTNYDKNSYIFAFLFFIFVLILFIPLKKQKIKPNTIIGRTSLRIYLILSSIVYLTIFLRIVNQRFYYSNDLNIFYVLVFITCLALLKNSLKGLLDLTFLIILILPLSIFLSYARLVSIDLFTITNINFSLNNIEKIFILLIFPLDNLVYGRNDENFKKNNLIAMALSFSILIVQLLVSISNFGTKFLINNEFSAWKHDSLFNFSIYFEKYGVLYLYILIFVMILKICYNLKLLQVLNKGKFKLISLLITTISSYYLINNYKLLNDYLEIIYFIFIGLLIFYYIDILGGKYVQNKSK